MPTLERTYALPESFTGFALRDLQRSAQEFEEHIEQLAKEAFCAKLVELFRECPNLQAVELCVDPRITEVPYAPYWPEVRYELDARLTYADAELDEEVPAAEMRQLETDYFGGRLARFCENLCLTRAQLFDEQHQLRFASLGELARWIEVDCRP